MFRGPMCSCEIPEWSASLLAVLVSFLNSENGALLTKKDSCVPVVGPVN